MTQINSRTALSVLSYRVTKPSVTNITYFFPSLTDNFYSNSRANSVGPCAQTASASNTIAMTNDSLILQPFLLSRPQTITSIIVEIVTVGVLNNLLCGVYSPEMLNSREDTGYSSPLNLAVDAGSIDTTLSTGEKTYSISVNLEPGLHWLGLVSQGGTPLILRANTTNEDGSLFTFGRSSTYSTTDTIGGYTYAGVSGAIPNPLDRTQFVLSTNTALPSFVLR